MEHLFLLRDILEGEVTAYGELLALSYQEKEAVTKNDVQQLSSITEKEQSILDTVRRYEADRKSLFSAIQAEQGLPDGKPTLKDVIETAQGELRQQLQGLAGELEDTAMKLRRISKLNKTLINSQLQYTSLCINLIMGPQTPLGTYSGSGQKNEECATDRRLVDQAI